MALDTYLRADPARCSGCGYHVETQGCRCGGSEWDIFTRAVRQVASPDGTVSQNKVRPLIRGRVNPKHIGQLYRRARSAGLLIDTGEREPSTDSRGRNADKLARLYKLRSAA